MAEYNLSTIENKKRENGRKGLSAQEMAVYTRKYGYDMLDNNVDDALNEEGTITLEGETQLTQEAADEQLGFFSRIGRFFSSSVNINFNGTMFTGKVGYQVKGGAVPLFDGVVVDFKPVTMKGEKADRGKQNVYPVNDTAPAILIITPKNMNNIKEYKVYDFIITAPKGGNVNEFRAKTQDQIEYPINDGRTLKANGADIKTDKVELLEPTVETSGNESTKPDSAVVNRYGLNINGVDINDYIPVGGNGGDLDNGADNGTDTNKGQEDKKEDAEEVKPKNGTDFDVNIAEKTFTLSWGKLWGNDDAVSDDEDENKSIKEKLEEYKKKIDEGYDRAKFGYEGIKEFLKTGKASEDTFGDDDDNDDDKEIEISASYKLFPGLSFEVKLSAEYNYGFRFGVSATKPEDDEDGSKTIEIKLKRNPDNGKPEVELKEPDEVVRNLNVEAGIYGIFSPKLSLLLIAGVAYILHVDGGVYAKADLKGLNKSDNLKLENILALGSVKLPVIIKNNGKVETKSNDMELGLNAGVELKGSVGAEANVVSELFDFEKELFDYQFKEWDIGSISWIAKYKRNPGGEFFSRAGWSNVENAFNLKYFGKEIGSRANNKYGIVTTQANTKLMDDATKEAGDVSDRMKTLNELIEKVINANNNKKIVVMDKDTGENNGLVSELKNLSIAIGGMLGKSDTELARIEAAIAKYTGSANYQKYSKKANTGMKKHGDRVKDMEFWMEVADEEDIDEAAHEYYVSTYGGKGAAAQKSKEDLLNAKKTVANKQALIDYENNRYIELTKKHDERIKGLEKALPENPDEPDMKFLEKYKELGGKRLVKEAYKYSSVDEILNYETGRRNFYAQKHKMRVASLNKKATELGITDKNKMKLPNAQFVEYYQKVIGGDRFFSHSVLMENHNNKDDLVKYERNKLESIDKKRMETIEFLRNAKDDKSRTQESIRKEYLKKTGIRGIGSSMFELAKSRGKAATKDDILEYEIDRYYKIKSGKGNDKDAQKASEFSRIIKDVYVYKSTPQEAISNLVKGKECMDLYKKWLDKKTPEQLIGMLDLEEIHTISQSLRDNGTNRKQLAYHNRNAEIADAAMLAIQKLGNEDFSKIFIDEINYINNMLGIGDNSTGRAQWNEYKKNDIKDKKKYYKKVSDDTAWKASIENGKNLEAWEDNVINYSMQDHTRKDQQEETLRKVALNAIFGIASDDKKKEFANYIKKNESLRKYTVTLDRLNECFEDFMETSTEKHGNRIRKLCKFMGIECEMPNKREDCKLDASKSPKTDIEVNNYYHIDPDMGAGSGFDAYYSEKKGQNFSIREMLNYEEKMMMEESEQSIFIRKRKELGIKFKNTINDDKKVEQKEINDLKEAMQGGHYRRYKILMDMMENNCSYEEMIDKYKRMGGGRGFEKELYKKRLESITPEEIINYENNWGGKEAHKHEERIKEITKLKDEKMPDEQIVAKYRQMSLTDSTNPIEKFVLSKLKDKIGLEKTTGFEKNADRAIILTPKVIMEYELSRKEELGKKHEERLKMLNNAEDDEKLMGKYLDMGGGSRFFYINSAQVSVRQQMNEAMDWGYDEIVAYEKQRQDFYQKMLEEVNKPVEEIKAVRDKINVQREKLVEYQKLLDNKNLDKVFGSMDSGQDSNMSLLREFSEATTGTEAQEISKASNEINTEAKNMASGDSVENIKKAYEDFMESMAEDADKDPLVYEN